MGSTTDIQDPTSQNAQAAQTQYDMLNQNPALYANGTSAPVGYNNFSGGVGFANGLPAVNTANQGGNQTGNITFDNQGLPVNFPTNALPDAYQNISNLYGNLGNEGTFYSGVAEGANNQALQMGQDQIQQTYQGGLQTQQGLTQSALPQSSNIYGTAGAQQGALGNSALGQSQSITNQNLSGLTDQMNQYDQNFISQLGPNGALGQQLAGEYNNYGITPNSGAFQQGLGNTLGSLGAQNQLSLGSALVNNGATSQQNLLGSTLGSQLGTSAAGAAGQNSILSQGLSGQLSTAQQGAQQGGTLANLYGINQMSLAQQGALAPYTQDQNAANQQSGIINEAANIPIDYYGSQNNQNFAQGLANQNASAQNNASNNQLYAGLGSAALMAAAK